MQSLRSGLQRSRDENEDRQRKARHKHRAQIYDDILNAIDGGMPVAEQYTPRGSDSSQATFDPDAPKVQIINGSATTMSTPRSVCELALPEDEAAAALARQGGRRKRSVRSPLRRPAYCCPACGRDMVWSRLPIQRPKCVRCHVRHDHKSAFFCEECTTHLCNKCAPDPGATPPRDEPADDRDDRAVRPRRDRGEAEHRRERRRRRGDSR